MDKIKIGDVLRFNQTELTIKNIYLFKSLNGKYRAAVEYDHKDLDTSKVTEDEMDVSLDFEGWEKV